MSTTVAPHHATLEPIGWLDTARRLQRVGFVLARHGFGEVVTRIGLAVPKLPFADKRVPRPGRFAMRLADTLTELGPTYLKLGQLLATRVDLFPAEVIAALGTLHAAVRPMPFAQVQHTIEESLGRPLGQCFGQFDESCLAAASIGQVHRARLLDGTEVVVKVQRPGLVSLVQADLTIMRRLAALLAQHVEEIAAYDPVALVDAFERSIAQELDFRTEAQNARRLRETLGAGSPVFIPQVFEHKTAERVLLMEYVAGVPLRDVPPARRVWVRSVLLRAFVRQALDHGVFHADPHPGNILVCRDGRVALLDFGSIDRLDPALRAQLMRLAIGLSLHRDGLLCQTLIRIGGAHGRSVDELRLRRELNALLASAGRGDGPRVIEQVLAISRAHRLRLPPALLSLARMLALLDGVLRGLAPERDAVADLRREFVWAIGRRAGALLRYPLDWLVLRVRSLLRLRLRAQRLLP